MTTRYRTFKKIDRFDRAQAFTTTPAGEFGWTIKDTSSSGTPTYLCVSKEGAVLTCDNTSEAQIVTLYQNNVLPFLFTQIKRLRLLLKVSGVDAVTTLVAGLASAQNDTSDTVTHNCWFRMEGSVSTSAVVVETDDNTTNDDDNATGHTLSSTLKEFIIDLAGGINDVRFIIDGQPVAGTFAMGAMATTDGVQIYFQLQKASGTGIPAVTIREVEIEYVAADG